MQEIVLKSAKKALFATLYRLTIPRINEIMNKIINIKKRILAISIEIISIPVNPNNPAISAKTRNVTTPDRPSIYSPLINTLVR